MSVRLAPSILSADFAALGDAVRTVERGGADQIHLDVMDGHFVPNLSVGTQVVEALRPLATAHGAILDVHLMIERPERQVAEFAKAGADMITVHWEATPHVHYALKAVRELGCLAGLALTPATYIGKAAELAKRL